METKPWSPTTQVWPHMSRGRTTLTLVFSKKESFHNGGFLLWTPPPPWITTRLPLTTPSRVRPSRDGVPRFIVVTVTSFREFRTSSETHPSRSGWASQWHEYHHTPVPRTLWDPVTRGLMHQGSTTRNPQVQRWMLVTTQKTDHLSSVKRKKRKEKEKKIHQWIYTVF